MAEGSSDEERLPDLFAKIWTIWKFLDKTEEPTNSYAVQSKAIAGLAAGEKAIRMINDLHLFSLNESIEEVSTNELKYMLIPAFMGHFLMRRVMKDRQELVRKGKAYFTDYLRQCKSYSVTNISAPIDEEETKEATQPGRLGPDRGPPDVMKLIGDRDAKIKKYKEQKELENRLSELQSEVEKEHVDDEVKRDYYLTLLKKWVNTSLEELDSINCELQMLEMREQLSNSGDDEQQLQQKNKVPPMRPFIITKDIIQKKVFGAGYPSLPSFTIEEFYEQKIKDGTFQIPEQTGHSMQDWANNPEKEKEDIEKEEEEKEKKAEEDDSETLTKARNWDDWKDDHRRGWGNRQNMG